MDRLRDLVPHDARERKRIFDHRLRRQCRACRPDLPEWPSFAPYEEVERNVLAPLPSTPEINTLSPRLFEAAALRTGMVMFQGEYSAAVQPHEHYLPLEKDFSNVGEVAEHLRDDNLMLALISQAYEHLIASGLYSERRFVEEFDTQLEERAIARATTTRHPERMLKLEQAAAGRGYHLSAAYTLAREAILGYLGVKNGLRTRALRRLLLQAGRSGARTSRAASLCKIVRLRSSPAFKPADRSSPGSRSGSSHGTTPTQEG